MAKRTKPASRVGRKVSAAAEAVGDRRATVIRLNTDAWRQLKIAAAERDQTMLDVITDALNQWFKAHGKPPIA